MEQTELELLVLSIVMKNPGVQANIIHHVTAGRVTMEDIQAALDSLTEELYIVRVNQTYYGVIDEQPAIGGT